MGNEQGDKQQGGEWKATEVPRPVKCPRCHGNRTVRKDREDKTCGMCGGRGFILTEHEDLELRSALTQLYEEYDHIEGAEFYISQGAQAVADLRAAQPSELREAAQMALDWFDKGLGQSAYAAEVMERLRAALRKG